MKKIKVKIQKGCKIPQYAHSNDSGCDIYVMEDTYFKYQIPTLVSTGVKLEIPDGYEVQVRPKSGLSSKGLWVSFGTVDQDYRGEIKVVAINFNPDKIIKLNKGDKIAQLVFSNNIVQAEFEEIDEISINTDRKEGGFGSSGK